MYQLYFVELEYYATYHTLHINDIDISNYNIFIIIQCLLYLEKEIEKKQTKIQNDNKENVSKYYIDLQHFLLFQICKFSHNWCNI